MKKYQAIMCNPARDDFFIEEGNYENCEEFVKDAFFKHNGHDIKNETFEQWWDIERYEWEEMPEESDLLDWIQEVTEESDCPDYCYFLKITENGKTIYTF